MAKTLNYYGTVNFQEQPYTGRLVTWITGSKETVSDAIATILLATGNFQLETDGTGEPATYTYDSNGNVVGLVNGSSTIGLASTYTWYTKPLASAYTGRAFISDIGGGSIWISNGTRWRPDSGRCVLYTLPADVSGTYAAVAVAVQHALKGGVWQDGDVLEVNYGHYKNGTTTVAQHCLRFGSAGLVTDTVLNNAVSLTGAPGVLNLRSGGINFIKRISSTSILLTNAGWNSLGVGLSAPVPTTVSSLDSDSFITFTTLATTSVGDTFTVTNFSLTLISQV